MKYLSLMLLMMLLLVPLESSLSKVTNKQISGQVFEGEIVINAPVEKVWAVLTDLEKFSDFMGFVWQSGKKRVENVGDTARMKVWSDNTTYFLTYVEPNKEIRLALEPDNASYICQKRWVLVPDGNKTVVKLMDIYTESSKQSEESLQQQANTWENHLEKLKALAEG